MYEDHYDSVSRDYFVLTGENLRALVSFVESMQFTVYMHYMNTDDRTAAVVVGLLYQTCFELKFWNVEYVQYNIPMPHVEFTSIEDPKDNLWH